MKSTYGVGFFLSRWFDSLELVARWN